MRSRASASRVRPRASFAPMDAERSITITTVRSAPWRGLTTRRASAPTAAKITKRLRRSESSRLSQRIQADSWCSRASDLKKGSVLTRTRLGRRRKR